MQLDTNETIFGFGERYDRFNENGRVPTLWGMDDWVGNTVGLLNQTYKPIPIFHSSKNKMVFDNSSYRLRADIGKTRPEELRLTQQGPVFDYYIRAVDGKNGPGLEPAITKHGGGGGKR
jgi:alpha-D-xyloside xylohydrolase